MSAFTTLDSKQLNLYQVGEVKIDGLTMYYICKGGQRYTVECADQSELDARLLEISNFGKGGGGSITVDSKVKVNEDDTAAGYLADKLAGATNSGISFTPSSDNSQLEISYEPAKAYKESLINYPANFINNWKIQTSNVLFTVVNPLCLFKTSTGSVVLINSTYQALTGKTIFAKLFQYDQSTLKFTQVAVTSEYNAETFTAGGYMTLNFTSTATDLNPYGTYYLCIATSGYLAFMGYTASSMDLNQATHAPFNFIAPNVTYATMLSTTEFDMNSTWCSQNMDSIWFMLKQQS